MLVEQRRIHAQVDIGRNMVGGMVRDQQQTGRRIAGDAERGAIGMSVHVGGLPAPRPSVTSIEKMTGGRWRPAAGPGDARASAGTAGACRHSGNASIAPGSIADLADSLESESRLTGVNA